MEPKVTTALISAIGSLVIAIVGIFISRNAQKTANKASEAAKRTEQIRLKATDVGDKILSQLAGIIIISESILVLLNHKVEKSLSHEEIEKYFVPMGKDLSELIRLLYSSAIYTTEKIRFTITETIAPILARNVDFKKWQQFVDKLKENHEQIAAEFYETYLKATL